VIVVKVGGSLYTRPHLGPELKAFLETLPAPMLLVPGGGSFADAVRAFDRLHRLGEEACHWLALEAMNLGGAFLCSLGISAPMLDAVAFCREHDELPHTWDATSDSVAALAARVFRASRLVLLKSVAIPPGTPWEEAAARGWVDPCFPRFAAYCGCPVETVFMSRFPPARGIW
jgi:aspartokinase-like uncharacterized kinase